MSVIAAIWCPSIAKGLSSKPNELQENKPQKSLRPSRIPGFGYEASAFAWYLVQHSSVPGKKWSRKRSSLDAKLQNWSIRHPVCTVTISNPRRWTQPHVRLSKLLVWRIDINIIWKGPIANHSFVAILPSLGTIDWQGVSLRLNTAQVDVTLYL